MESILELLPQGETGLIDLEKEKRQGKKLVGYVPNGYLPEEMICACGAVPVALGRGGEQAAVAASASCLARFLDPFCRAQIGYRLLDEDPAYRLIDLLVVPVTDNHVRAIADSWDFYSGVEVFRFGVPHVKAPHGIAYYLEGLSLLRERLQSMTGVEMTDEALSCEIEVANRIRALLGEISLTRKADSPPLGGGEFITLNHASLIADRFVVAEHLRSIRERLGEAQSSGPARPRVLLAGSTLAMGDSKIVDLLEAAGASIVAEEFSEGLREYRCPVDTGGDPVAALADACFTRRLPDAFFRGAAEERIAFFLDMVEGYRVDGVVWYTLMYRDSYDVEGYILRRHLDERGIPMLRISSDYNDSETGNFRTRIETFVDTL